jgi:hypothetical protein
VKFAQKVGEMLSQGVGNMGSEIKAELGRLGLQGRAEVAAALFNEKAYTPYGEGQKSPDVENSNHVGGPEIGPAKANPEVAKEKSAEKETALEKELERGGREM